MWLSDTSVKRPVLATVLNLLLVVFGLFALLNITVREYPDIDPPVVSVSTNYPGASAAVVETQITQLLEDRIAGIEGIRSISSASRDGRSNITIEFSLSRDVEDAANDVRDRVSRALNNLPDEADPPEVSKSDDDASPVIWLTLSSPALSTLELTDYADRFLADRFGALDGVSQVRIGGDRLPAMRIWLDRRALAARGLTALDVEQALRTQNVERPAGRLESKDRELSLRTARPYATAEDFRKLVVARGAEGYPVRLGEVAQVEIAPAESRTLFRANGEPAIGLGIIKQSKANTLAVTRAAKDEMQRVIPSLPQGMTLKVNSDFSLFIEASLAEVVFTLFFASALVVVVIFVFLGNARATLIPALTVPISLIATFIFLYSFDFSINLLTMLALVLAIGLVVDDTIIMVENIHRRVELGEPPLLAAYRGAREVGFAIVATTLVLVAVFTPLAFLQGNIGRLFREFALSMSAAVACSSVVALTLSPVLCALLLKPDAESGRLTRALGRALARVSDGYRQVLGRWVGRRVLAVVALLALLAASVLLLRLLPEEFAPAEDRGQLFVQMTGPEGASFDYSQRYMAVIEDRLLARLGDGEIDRFIIRVPGFGGSADVNSGTALVSLTDWQARARSAGEIGQDIDREMKELPGVRATVSERSAFVRRIGQPVQFTLGGSTYEELAQWRDTLMTRIARDNPRLTRLDSNYKETKPQLSVETDLDRAADLGVSVQDLGRTLEILLGSQRVTTYIDRGQEYDVMLQARAQDRATPRDLANIYVRAQASGTLVPLSNLVRVREGATAASYSRYDRLRAITISAGLAPGYTLGEAVSYIETLVRETLPPTARLSWQGEARELKESSQALLLSFGLALLVVFLVLAAQFESFVHPFVIMTTVPLAVFGALAGLGAFGMSLNIYSQIGMIMLIGLAAKNGILIVEFANQRRDAGLPLREALVEAAQIRLRPILMTSISTVVGVLPLILASGAGAEAREVLGQVVFWGVLFSTLLTLFLVPAFYALMAGGTTSPEHVARRLAEQESTAGREAAIK
jgi:multidrug efflux pump